MSSALFDTIARIARHEAQARAVAAVGVVSDVYPAEGATVDYAATVRLRDTGLVLPRVPLATGVLGAVAIPAVGELVVVVFLEGDYNAPVIVGRLYHPEQDPPPHQEGQLVLALPTGASEPKLRLQVTGATPAIELDLPGGEVRLLINDGQIQLKLGGLSLSLTGSGGGRAELIAGGTKLILKQDGDVTLETPGTLTLKATTIELAGSASVKISGAQVEIN